MTRKIQRELDKCCARMDITQQRMWKDAKAKYADAEEQVGHFYATGPQCHALYVDGELVASIVSRLL